MPMASFSDQAIVVGGGLAGMSAASTISANELLAALLCWTSRSVCGGMSTKATSGINGGNTKTQHETGFKDSADLFTCGPLKGGAKKKKEPQLVMVMCQNSGADVEWLVKFDPFAMEESNTFASFPVLNLQTQ